MTKRGSSELRSRHYESLSLSPPNCIKILILDNPLVFEVIAINLIVCISDSNKI